MIETVVAVTLLAIALIAILSLVPATNAAARQAEVRLQAQSLAQSILEEQRLTGQPSPRPAIALETIYGTGFPAMHPTLEVITCGAGGRAREVRVTLTWEQYGRTSSLAVASVVTRLQR